MIKRILLLSTLLTALPSLAHAEDITEVEVTVTRHRLEAVKVGQAIDVLDKDDIKTYQSVMLVDLLTRTTDLSVTRNGGPGAAASASIRGAGADHTLYLLDGVRLNDPSQVGGGANLGLIATDDIERIEVLRGPLSTLWGSGALGGVVSLTARDGPGIEGCCILEEPDGTVTLVDGFRRIPLEGRVSAEGFDDYNRTHATVAGASNGLTWRLSGNAIHDKGVSAFAGGSEPDGFDQTSLTARVKYAFDRKNRIIAYTAYSRSRNDYDGYLPPSYAFTDTDEFGRTLTRLSYLTLQNSLFEGNHTALDHNLSISDTDSDRHDDFADDSQFVARGHIQSADYHLVYNDHDEIRLLGGVTYQRDSMRIASPTPWDPNPAPLSVSQNTISLYGQASRDFDETTVTLSARHDDNSSFGGQDIAQLSLATAFSDNVRLHASAGQGVKTPSLYQLYSPYGTQDLVAEKGVTLDAGIDVSLYYESWIGATVFTRTVRDLIDFRYSDCLPTQLYGCYGSIDSAKATGLELEGHFTFNGTLVVSGNYSLLATENRSPGLEGKALPHAPEQMGNVSVDWKLDDDLSLGTSLRHVGDSFDNASNSRKLAGYDLIDLRFSHDLDSLWLNHDLRLYGRIENAGDTRYETAGGYGQPGRRIWIGIEARLF